MSPQLSHQIRRLLQAAGHEVVPSRLLAAWGRTDFPAGDENAPVMSQWAWCGLYWLLENAALEPGVVRPLPFVLARTLDVRPDAPVPIAILDYRVAVPRPGPVEEIREAAAHGTAWKRPPSDPADAIEQRQVFAATGLLHEQWKRPVPAHRGRDVRFVLDRTLYCMGPGGRPPDRVEASLDGGQSWSVVEFGEPFGPCRASEETVEVGIRCWFDGESRLARFAVPVTDDLAPRDPDETWRLQAAESGTAPPARGRAWVFRAPGHDTLRNPVILVEGFPGGHPWDYTYEQLNYHGMVDGLLAAGYDLVLVGLDNGMVPIASNAPVLVECIRKVREATTQPLVVGGVSMGGLVSRYALADMERTGTPHGTRVYLSIDAPHGGTYTSLGVQWFVQSLAPYVGALGAFSALLNAPSNQELLIWWLNKGEVTTSELRATFLKELKDRGGYPRQPRKLAVSCGRGDGVGNQVKAGTPTLAWDGPPLVSMAIDTLPGRAGEEVAHGTWLLAESPELKPLHAPDAHPWETAPGSLNTYNLQAGLFAQNIGCGTAAFDNPLTCGVPTRSALDLSLDDPFAPVAGEPGPFDASICSEDNVEHLELTQAVSEWVLDELGAPPEPTRDEAARGLPTWNPSAFDPYAPAFQSDPYPTYARFREHAPDFFVTQFGSRWFFGYGACKTILDDKQLFVKNNPDGAKPLPGPFGILGEFGTTLFTSDPARHTDLRRVFARAFYDTIGAAGPTAAGVAAVCLTTMRTAGRAELVMDYATPVPATVAFNVIGIPDEQEVRMPLFQWVSMFVTGRDPRQSLTAQVGSGMAAMSVQVYLQGLLRQYEREGDGAGVLGILARNRQGLTAEEIYRSAVEFVFAGYLSTTWLIASAIYRLSPEQLDALRATDHASLKRATDEVLRVEPPVQLVDRFATEDTELAGVTLRRGDKVTAVIGSANRDPAYFDDPDVVDIARVPRVGHLSFGNGIHRCVGEPLADVVAPIMLEQLLLRVPELAVDGIPQWQVDPYLRGLVNLPVRC